jgi:hypothetical protein
LPCDHDISEALLVHAHSIGKGSERVEIRWSDGAVRLAVIDKPGGAGPNSIAYVLAGAKLLWEKIVVYYEDDQQVTADLGDWLTSQDEKTVRAFLNRWNTTESVPTWRLLQLPGFYIKS